MLWRHWEDVESTLGGELERFSEYAWERKVNNKEGTFFEESGHDSWEKFSVNFWPKYFSAVEGHTVWICTVPTVYTNLARKSRQFLAWFLRQFLDFRWLFLGCTEQSVQWTGHGKQGTEEAGQRYDFGTKNEADFCGTDLVLWGIFLGWKCCFAADMYFPEAE